MCGWGGGKGGFGVGQGAAWDCKTGQLIQSMGPAQGEVRIIAQTAITLSKRV
jgi:hypothetical protein